MKQIKTRKFLSFSLTLLVGWAIGSTWSGPVVAADSATGEIIKVCIDSKTGVIKAATKCSKTERATILGGVGPKGDKGDVGSQGLSGTNGTNGTNGVDGATGPQGLMGPQGGQGERGLTGGQGERGLTGSQGPQGYTGATGATGSISSLRTKSITVWTQDYGSYCGSSFLGFSALNSSTSLSSYGNTISLNKSCSTLYSSNVTVYAP